MISTTSQLLYPQERDQVPIVSRYVVSKSFHMVARNSNSSNITCACLKGQLELGRNASVYNWATLPLGSINMETPGERKLI